MNSPTDICGTIACLKLSAHVFPGVNFVVFDLKQDLNISKFVFITRFHPVVRLYELCLAVFKLR